MKSKILVLVLLVLACKGFTQEIGGLFIGVNEATGSMVNRFEINPEGTCWGFFIPVNIESKINIVFKFKACHHSTNYNTSFWDGDFTNYKYTGVTNELQLGCPIQITKKVYLLPQVGIGIMGEAVHKNYKEGFSDWNSFYDISLTSVYDFTAFSIGPMINYERYHSDGRGKMLSRHRIILSIVIMK
ncbi:MAG TPA: hypothetical protein PLP19_14025 [bacterium]|nr:hypothetical protein [bacterium]HPN44606.1 hypothetical protein [bacterium]